MSTTNPAPLFEGSSLEFLSQGPATVIARIRGGIPADAVDTLAQELGVSVPVSPQRLDKQWSRVAP